MQRLIVVNVSLPEDLSAELGAYSKAQRCSKANAVASIVKAHLDQVRAEQS